MYQALPASPDLPKADSYALLVEQTHALLEGESDRVACAANFAALVFHALPDLNWAGFYFFDGKELVVGPFQGKPACVRIALGRGVCGTAAGTRTTQLVHDVHAFEGHIACDSASNSEIVVPIIHNGELTKPINAAWKHWSPRLSRTCELASAARGGPPRRPSRLWPRQSCKLYPGFSGRGAAQIWPRVSIGEW